jgi:hypothetical protein
LSHQNLQSFPFLAEFSTLLEIQYRGKHVYMVDEQEVVRGPKRMNLVCIL